jgi:hypothetical protein
MQLDPLVSPGRRIVMAALGAALALGALPAHVCRTPARDWWLKRWDSA